MTTSPIENITDDDARLIIANELYKNIYVEAGAGTGKTTSLVDRIVSLIRQGRVPIDQIVAITFTRAAAAELRSRIREKLEEISIQEQDNEQIKKSLDEIDSAAFQTIDSFALSIVREWSLEAGLPPDVSIKDDLIASQEFAESWREWLIDTLDNDGEFALVLARAMELGMSNPVARLRDLAGMIKPVHLQMEIPSVQLDVMGAIGSVNDQINDLIELLGHCVNPDIDRLAMPMQEWIGWHSQHIDGKELESEGEAESILASYPRTPKTTRLGNKGNWDIGTLDQARGALSELQEHVQSVNEQIKASLVRDIYRYARSFSESLINERRLTGSPTFDDSISWAIDLLENNNEVRARIQERFKRILVDEFQDTDPRQVRLVELLTTPIGKNMYAPGALFAVGDPKQSIYRFRGADVTVSQLVGKKIEDDVQNSLKTTLRENHRSLSPVIKWVNTVFGNWMQSEVSADTGDAQANLQHDSSSALRSLFSLIANWIALEPDENLKQVSEQNAVYRFGESIEVERIHEVRDIDAVQVAQIARAVCNGSIQVRDEDGALRPSRPGDLAIITRARSNWTTYRKALDDADVPNVAEGEGAGFDPQEFRDLVNCLTAIDDPTNEPAMVGALKSIYFACSDIELQEWVQKGGKFSYTSQTPDQLRHSNIAKAMQTLGKFHELRDTNPLPVVMERLIRNCKVRELIYLEGDPSTSLRRIDWAVELARNFEDLGADSIREGITMLKAYPEFLQDKREQPRSSRGSSVVRLMTIHYSKGLEFPVVILPDLAGDFRHRAAPILMRSVGSEKNGGDFALRMGGDFVLGEYEWFKEYDRASEMLERTRSYYVAATRARDALIVSQNRKLNPKRHLSEETDVAAIIQQHTKSAPDIWQSMPLGIDGKTLDLNQTWPHVQYKSLKPEPPASETAIPPRGEWMHNHEATIQKASSRSWITPSSLKSDNESLDAVLEEEEKPDQSFISDPDLPYQRGRAATDIGKAVHAAMQRILEASDADIDRVAKVAKHEAHKHNVSEHVDEIKELVIATLNTPLLKRILSIPHQDIWVETPVAVRLDSDGDQTTNILEGKVDLIYQLADGTLGVADFKTDRSFNRLVKGMAQPYVPQLAAYAYAVQQATGKPVSEACLLFSRVAIENPQEAEYWISDIESEIQQILMLAVKDR